MKLYFAGCLQKSHSKKIERIKRPINILGSFWEANNNEANIQAFFDNPYATNWFIDSGAFSALTRKITINLEDYITFLKRIPKDHVNYAGLDVIGDWQSSRKNQEIMEAEGLSPIPTFHYGSPEQELKRLIKKYDYIALGGLVPISMQRKKIAAWLDYCFSIIRTKIKIHGFGVNSLWCWERYPFYSVDATSWLMGEKFRRTLYFDRGQLKTATKGSKERNIYTMKAHTDHYSDQSLQNAKTYLELEQRTTRLWEKRGVIWEN